LPRSVIRRAGALAIGVGLAALAACSSSPAPTSSTTSGFDVTPFKAAVDQFLKGSPSSFEGPSSSPGAPSNVKIWIMPCSASLSGCETPAQYAKQAATALGWHVTMFDGQGSPRTENAGLLDAVAAGAQVIVTVSVSPDLVQQGLKAATQAHIPVVSVSNGTGSPNPPPASQPPYHYAVDVSVNYLAIGKAMADAVIADSGGKADVLVMGDKEFPSVNLTQQAILSELAKCTTCKVNPVVYFTSDSVATSLGQQTVGYLQSHPDVDYVISPYDPAAAVQVPAIQAAGLASKVKLVSVVAAPENLAFIAQGRVQFADTAEGNNYLGYAAIDQAIRLLKSQPPYVPNGENTPLALLERGNLPPTGQQWSPEFNFEQSYMNIWKKG
jgi:ribose transport system substrate-binding protein